MSSLRVLPRDIAWLPWSAAAFARIKSVIVTSLKNGLRFIHYGLDAVRAQLKGDTLPLPLKA